MKTPLPSFLLFPFMLLFLLQVLLGMREPADGVCPDDPKAEPVAAKLDPVEPATLVEKLSVQPVRPLAAASISPPAR